MADGWRFVERTSLNPNVDGSSSSSSSASGSRLSPSRSSLTSLFVARTRRCSSPNTDVGEPRSSTLGGRDSTRFSGRLRYLADDDAHHSAVGRFQRYLFRSRQTDKTCRQTFFDVTGDGGSVGWRQASRSLGVEFDRRSERGRKVRLGPSSSKVTPVLPVSFLHKEGQVEFLRLFSRQLPCASDSIDPTPVVQIALRDQISRRSLHLACSLHEQASLCVEFRSYAPHNRLYACESRRFSVRRCVDSFRQLLASGFCIARRWPIAKLWASGAWVYGREESR